MNDSSSPPAPKDPSLYQKTIKGGGWVLTGRIFQQLISVVKLSTLAHLLAPRDFGILALALVAKRLLEVFTQTGIETALIRQKEISSDDLHVAWTINVFRGIVLFAFFFIAAPLTVVFFDGSGLFEPNHILEPQVIAEELLYPDDRFAEYLSQKIPEEQKALLLEAYNHPGTHLENKALLSSLLNTIIESNNFSEIPYLSEYGLSQDTLEQLKIASSVSTKMLVRSNRLILQKIYDNPIRSVVLNRKEVTIILQVLAVTFVISGFRNISLVRLSKELQFNRLFVLQFIQSILGALLAIAFAFWMRNVWALVWSNLIQAILALIISYMINPFMPGIKICIGRMKKFWSFGRYVFGQSILSFVLNEGDDIIVGKMLGPVALGYYRYAYNLSDKTSSEAGLVVSKVSFPAFSQIQDNFEKIRGGFIKTTMVLSFVVFPLTAILFLFAHDIVYYLLGQEWLHITRPVQVLCILGLLKCIQTRNVFWAIGKPDIPFKLSIMRLIVMLVLIFPLTKYYGILGTAITMLATAVFLYPVNIILLKKYMGVGIFDMFSAIKIPLSAILFACIIVLIIKYIYSFESLVAFIVIVGIFAVSYVTYIGLMIFVFKQKSLLTLFNDVISSMKKG